MTFVADTYIRAVDNFLNRFVIAGIGIMASVYTADINLILGGSVDLDDTFINPGDPPTTYTIPPELW